MELELVSFKICPFVQRAVATLRYKQTAFKLTHIDLSDPPHWFKAISPFGKVPLLKVDKQHVIFESAVINEFLDDITSGSLLPDDPLLRALNRSWIEFGSACLLNLSAQLHAEDKQTFDSNRDELKSKMKWLEATLDQPPYFNGDTLSLVDFSWAPLFMRAEILTLDDQLYPAEHLPRTAAWARRLLELPAVRDSVVADFPELLRNHIRAKAPYAAQQFGL
ncbi:MAG: glutathione S-transferase family protein [Pseudomonadota bacterium]|nr:glutathione S-transferase family protein [Pseudomonadota bacterium]